MPDGQVRIDIRATSDIPEIVAADIAAITREQVALNTLIAESRRANIDPSILAEFNRRIDESIVKINAYADALRQAGVGVKISGLEQVGTPPPPTPPRDPNLEYDLQRRIDIFSQISNARDRDKQEAIRESETVATAQRQANDYDLQRRLDVFSQISSARDRDKQAAIRESEEAAAAVKRDNEEVLQRRLSAAFAVRPTFQRTVDPEVAARAKELGGTLEGVGNRVSNLGNIFSAFSRNSGRETRELGAIIDEIASGSYRRLESSIVVLLNYSGLLGQAIRGAFTPTGAVIATAVAGIAALGYEAEQAYQRFASIRTATGNLGLQGLGNQTEAMAAQFDRLRSSTDEYAGTARKLQAGISELNPAARAVGESLAEQAKAFAALKGQDPVKVLDELVKAANRSPEALAKVRVEYLGLQDVISKSGFSLEQQTSAIAGATSQYQFAAHAGEELRQVELKAGATVAQAKNDFWNNALALSGMAEGAGFASEGAQQVAHSMEIAVDPAKALGDAIKDLTEDERNQILVVQQGNAVIAKRTELMNQWALVQTSIGRVPGAETAAAQIEAQLRGQRDDPAAARQHRLNLEDIRAEAEARKASVQSAADVARARENEIRRDETQRFIDQGADPDTAERLSDSQESVIKAHNETLEAERRVQDQSVALTRIGIQARIAAEAQGSEQVVQLRQRELDLARQQEAAGRGTPEQTAQAQVQLEAAQRAHNDQMLQVTVRRLDAEEAYYRNNADRVLQIEREKNAEIRRHAEGQILRTAGPISPEELQRQVGQRPDVAQSDQRVVESADRAAKERLEIEILNQREIAASDRRGGQERIAAQLAILQIMEANERLYGPVAIAQQEIAVITARRQAQDQAFQTEREETQIAVAEAKEHAGAVEKIAEAYDHLRQVARETGQLPRVQMQINRDQSSTDRALRNEAFSRLMEQNSAEEKLAQSRVAAFTASERAMVDAHRMSKTDMAAAVENFQATEMAAQEARLEEELKVDGLTDIERQKLNDRLAELYAKDAAQHEQAQERITRSIEEENDKRIKAFTNFFDTTGSALEKFLTEGVTRSTTRAQALQQLGRSLASSVISTAGHFASEAAGSFVGPKLGLTDEQSKGGLGEVFGTAITKALGLFKETPQQNQARAAELFQKSAEAQARATGSNTTAIEELTKAIKAETESRQRAKQDLRNVKQGEQAGIDSAGEYGGVGQTGGGPGRFSVSQMRQLALNAGFKGQDADIMAATAMAESGGDPNSIGDKAIGGSFGLTQINLRAHGEVAKTALGNPQQAFNLAYGVYHEAGDKFTPWTMYNTGAYRKYLQHGGSDQPSVAMPATAQASTGDNRYSGTFEDTQKRTTGSDVSSQVAEGVTKGQQQAAPAVQTAVMSGTSEGQRAAAPAVTDATKAGIEAGDDDLTAGMKQSAQAVTDNKVSLDKNTQALSQQKPGGGQTSPTVPGGSAVGGAEEKTGQMSVNLGLLTQGLGIAATAASVFGRQLSTQARTVLGAVGVLSQVAGFAKSAGSALDLFGTATKGTQTATTLMQTANIGNTAATTANTLATTANSAAETSNSAGKAIGGAASGIGSAFKAIPLLGALFEQGGIVPAAVGGMMVGTSVPSAAGGMVVPGSALGGGGQLSILHPREMVLPAHLSAAVQRMANSSLPSANTSVGDARNSFQTLPPPPQVTHNSPQSSFTYAPQITGRFSSPSAAEMRGILRTHGDLFDNYARNYMRNNHL